MDLLYSGNHLRRDEDVADAIAATAVGRPLGMVGVMRKVGMVRGGRGLEILPGAVGGDDGPVHAPGFPGEDAFVKVERLFRFLRDSCFTIATDAAAAQQPREERRQGGQVGAEDGHQHLEDGPRGGVGLGIGDVDGGCLGNGPDATGADDADAGQKLKRGRQQRGQREIKHTGRRAESCRRGQSFFGC